MLEAKEEEKKEMDHSWYVLHFAQNQEKVKRRNKKQRRDLTHNTFDDEGVGDDDDDDDDDFIGLASSSSANPWLPGQSLVGSHPICWLDHIRYVVATGNGTDHIAF
jgi:hypothetical protein